MNSFFLPGSESHLLHCKLKFLGIHLIKQSSTQNREGTASLRQILASVHLTVNLYLV